MYQKLGFLSNSSEIEPKIYPVEKVLPHERGGNVRSEVGLGKSISERVAERGSSLVSNHPSRGKNEY